MNDSARSIKPQHTSYTQLRERRVTLERLKNDAATRSSEIIHYEQRLSQPRTTCDSALHTSEVEPYEMLVDFKRFSDSLGSFHPNAAVCTYHCSACTHDHTRTPNTHNHTYTYTHTHLQ